jgi:hypothetical protein
VGKKKESKTARIGDLEAVQTWTSLSSPERQELAAKCLEGYPLNEEERKVFVQSPRRVDKVLGIEKYRDARIVATIVASDACIAGHAVGDTIAFDSMGRLVAATDDKPVCIRLLNRIWYRLIMILDRMGDDTGETVGDGSFQGEVIEVRMNCFGAPFPYGDCGQVLMEFSVQEAVKFFEEHLVS